jgi:UrcA family protein
MNTMTPSSRLHVLVAAAILSPLALCFTAVGAAAESTDVPTAIVKYGDLNVSSPQGAAVLYSRIRGAAHQVCWSVGRDLASTNLAHTCIHKAIADAVTKVGQPELFAVYNAKNRRPLPMAVATAQSR